MIRIEKAIGKRQATDEVCTQENPNDNQYERVSPRAMQPPKLTRRRVPRRWVLRHSACQAGIVDAMKL